MSIRHAEKKDITDMLRLLTEVNMVHHTIRPDLFKGPATKYSHEELEQKLEGLPYEREALLAALRQVPLDQYLGDVTAEELAQVIV